MRRLLAFLIALGLVMSPVGAAVGAMSHGFDMTAVAAPMDPGTDTSDAEMEAMEAMEAMDMAACDCTGCDPKSKCPDQATCMAKCCKVLSAIESAAMFIVLPEMHYRLPEPAKPPAWVSAPPASPPRS